MVRSKFLIAILDLNFVSLFTGFCKHDDFEEIFHKISGLIEKNGPFGYWFCYVDAGSIDWSNYDLSKRINVT